MGKPHHADTLPVNAGDGPYILESAPILHEPGSLGKTQEEHKDHPAMGPPHRPKMKADPTRELDGYPGHPFPFGIRQGHTPIIYHECDHLSSARPHRGKGGTPDQTHAPLSITPTKEGEQTKGIPQTQSTHHSEASLRQRRQRRERGHQPCIREMHPSTHQTQ